MPAFSIPARAGRGLFLAAAWCLFASASPLAADPTDASPPQALARKILHATGTRGGLVVHLGCGDGRLTAALGADPRCVVQGLDADPARVEAARRHVRSLGLYGRVSVQRFRGSRLPYADNLVNLLVVEDPEAVAGDELLRVLAPLGTAYVRKGAQWTKITKPWPQSIDQWTHFLHGPDNNAVARDSLVGPPRRMRWTAGPLWCRSHEIDSSISALVSARGRLFYIHDEGLIGITDQWLPQTWSLVARDAFNGMPLWKRPVGPWGWRQWKYEKLAGKDWTQLFGERARIPVTLTRRLVADGRRVYVTLGYDAPLSILDAATGETIHTVAGTEGTDEILAAGDTLVLCIRDLQGQRAKRRGEPVANAVVAVEATSGKVLWKRPAPGIAPLSLAVAGNAVFYHTRKKAVSLGLADGSPRWSVPTTTGGGTLVVHEDVVLISNAKRMAAFSTADGRQLWTYQGNAARGASSADLFVIGDLVWRGMTDTGIDLHTGKVAKQIKVANLRSGPHHHRCYRNKATQRYLMSAKEGIESLDLRDGNHSRDNWVRGVCKLGIMPSNGLIYSPPDQCFCEPGVKLLGFSALAAADPHQPREDPVEGRLERGPAYEKPLPPSATLASSDAWPTYRHDAARSGSTSTPVAAEPKPLWQVELGSRLTPPVVAGGKLLVGSVDRHTVHAFDSRDGAALWSYTAGGRVDSPPTIHRGLVLFGSADGWVYCLRLDDGQLVWRFRAAPRRKLIGAFGQVESAWPVHGSVLASGGVVYCAAGRSSYLDGGIRLYGLDPASGKLLCRGLVEGPYADLEKGPGQTFYTDGALVDILSSDGQSVYMRQVQLDMKLHEQHSPYLTSLGNKAMGLHLVCTSGFLDDSGFNRIFWMYSKVWPGFYIANQAPKTGQMLVFDDRSTYGVKMFTHRNRHSPMFFPATDGLLLFADDNQNEPFLKDADDTSEPIRWLPQSSYNSSRGIRDLSAVAAGQDKGVGFTRIKPPLWSTWIAVRVRGMVLAGRTLFVAGPPDVLDPDDPLAAYQGRKGARLLAVSAAEGKKLSELKLKSEPVFDGLIAAGGRLYLSTRDGRVECFGR